MRSFDRDQRDERGERDDGDERHDDGRVARLERAMEELSARVRVLEAELRAKAGAGSAAINPDAMYSPAQAGAFLRLSRQTIYMKIASGVLPASVLPNSNRQLIAGRDILALIARLRPAAR